MSYRLTDPSSTRALRFPRDAATGTSVEACPVKTTTDEDRGWLRYPLPTNPSSCRQQGHGDDRDPG